MHLRTCLYEAANALLGTRSRPDTALKRWGLGLKARLGHKRAVVAVARKLAVVLHAMMVERRAVQDRRRRGRRLSERPTSAHPSASGGAAVPAGTTSGSPRYARRGHLDRDEETELDFVPETIVRLTSRQTAETTPSPAEHSSSFERGGEP